MPVPSKAAYFLREDGLDLDPLFQLLERGTVRLQFDDSTHWPRIRALMARCRQMDLADAAVVVMSEVHPRIDFVAPPKR